MIDWGSRRPKPPNHATQLLALRDFVAKYGCLHEAQALQLKLWPRVAFPHSTQETTSEVNLADREVVVKVISKKSHNKTKTRAIMLTKNIRWMLGVEWGVQVFENGKLLLKKAGQKPKNYAGTDFAAGKLVPKTPWKFQSQTQPSPK